MDRSKIFLVFMMMLLPCFQAAGQYKLYGKGFESYQNGNYKEAITNFTEYLSKSIRDRSLDAEVFYLRGLSHFKLQNYKNAIGDFEETLLLNHANKANIFWFLAKSNEQLGYYPDAIRYYTSAIEGLKSDREKYVKLLFERSQVYANLPDLYLAYADLQAAYEIQPGNEDVKKALAKIDKVGLPATKNSMVATRALAPDSTLNKELAERFKDEKRYALVIGNGSYAKNIGELRNPVNDAADMARELEKSDFDVQLLTNATYGQIRAELLKFKEKLDEGARDNTVGLFYFAGHGLRQEDENYLVPVDAVIEFEDDIRRYCFPVQQMVLANMERSKSRLNILILDACRNNPFPSLTRSLGDQGLTEIKEGRGSFIAYSTAPGGVAQDGLGRNGLYTQELLRAMRKRGLNLEQVFKEVRLNVLRLSGEKQKTWDNSNISGEFYFKF
jgi:tetratricopeptide (TPR) repeat protein